MRIGMGCKAQTADIAAAMARICNAADRPRPRPHTREEIVNTFLNRCHGVLTGWKQLQHPAEGPACT
mgnify:FL=1